MKGKISRAACAAGVAVCVFGAAAVSAEAADTLYFVNGPTLRPATAVTPASAVVSGTIDTGGVPGGQFTLAPGGSLAWGGGLTAVNTGTASETFSYGGLPISGADTNVMVAGGNPSVVSNGGAVDYSDVEFEYDTLADYTAAGDSPGQNTQYATEVDVPTTYGLSDVSTTLGAFGTAAQTRTGNTPLKPNTKYVYWLSDQAGATSDAETVNTFDPSAPGASTSVNPSFKCLPDAYIQANAYLKGLASGGTVSGGVSSPGGAAQTTPQQQIQGPCVYIYGNTNGQDFYNSPTGEFTTTKVGRLTIGRTATVSGRTATVRIASRSAYRASGTLQLSSTGGAALASGTFSLAAGRSGTVKLRLTRAGVAAARKGRTGHLTLNSNWGQTSGTKAIRL